jgi:transposase
MRLLVQRLLRNRFGRRSEQLSPDQLEQLDIVPSQLRVRVTRRPRYACRACEGTVVVAPAPERPIDGGMATEALIIHVIVSKFCDSLPLYRQSQMLARQGIALDRSTLGNWVGRACWWLAPLYDLVVSTVLSSTKIFADDTSLPVLGPGRGRMKVGRLWCYAVDDRPWCGPTHPAAAYVYTTDRKNERPAGHLSGFSGVLQVDGYDRFKRLAEGRLDGNVRLAFCWAHMRRGVLRVLHLDKIAAGPRVVDSDSHPVCHRGRNPRTVRRTPQAGVTDAKSTDRRSLVYAVAGSCRAGVQSIRSVGRYPLRHPALAGPGGVPR